MTDHDRPVRRGGRPTSSGCWRLLGGNERQRRRERLTLVRIFEELQVMDHRGGCDAVRRHAVAWRSGRSMVTARGLCAAGFAPGEVGRFNWSRGGVAMGGASTTVKVARMRPCRSRTFLVRAYSYLGARGPDSRASAMSLVGNVVDMLGAAHPLDTRRRADLGRVFEFLGLSSDLAVVFRAARASSRLWRTVGRQAQAAELGRLADGFDRFAPLRRARSAEALEGLLDAIAIVGPILGRGAGLRLRAALGVGAVEADGEAVLHAARTLRSFGLLDCVGAEAVRLDRPGAPFDLSQASSGELAILVTFVGLSVALRDGGLVLVDEPELSLHPAWQAAWLELLLDAFSEYPGCHFLVATHSALIVGDAPLRHARVVSLDRRHAGLQAPKALDSGSADAALVNAFGVASDGNFYVRDLLARALRLAYEGHLAGEESMLLIEELAGVRGLLRRESPLGRAIDVLADARRRLGSAG